MEEEVVTKSELHVKVKPHHVAEVTAITKETSEFSKQFQIRTTFKGFITVKVTSISSKDKSIETVMMLQGSLYDILKGAMLEQKYSFVTVDDTNKTVVVTTNGILHCTVVAPETVKVKQNPIMG